MRHFRLLDVCNRETNSRIMQLGHSLVTIKTSFWQTGFYKKFSKLT